MQIILTLMWVKSCEELFLYSMSLSLSFLYIKARPYCNETLLRVYHEQRKSKRESGFLIWD